MNPQIKPDSEYTNPHLYQDIKQWYNELGEQLQNRRINFINAFKTYRYSIDYGDCAFVYCISKNEFFFFRKDEYELLMRRMKQLNTKNDVELICKNYV